MAHAPKHVRAEHDNNQREEDDDADEDPGRGLARSRLRDVEADEVNVKIAREALGACEIRLPHEADAQLRAVRGADDERVKLLGKIRCCVDACPIGVDEGVLGDVLVAEVELGVGARVGAALERGEELVEQEAVELVMARVALDAGDLDGLDGRVDDVGDDEGLVEGRVAAGDRSLDCDEREDHEEDRGEKVER